MTVWIKQGCIGQLTPRCQKAQGKIHDHYYKNYGIDLYVTSKRDGNHISGSLHYIGDAFDIARDKQHDPVRIKSLLGEDFDVVPYEGHIHIEYDKK